jgi:hypothetical protein
MRTNRKTGFVDATRSPKAISDASGRILTGEIVGGGFC